jgi:hypothetical protein
MSEYNETFNRNLYGLLRTRGYNPVPKNSKNERTEPEEADVFKFTFKKDGQEYGDAWVTLDDDGKVTLYSSNELEDSPEAKTPGLDYDDTWSGFRKQLKYWALTNQPRHAKGYQELNRDRLGDDMARREYMKKKEKLGEGYYPMGKQASYNDNIPTVKIILQHTRQIQEGEQRYRNVAKIFLENTLGERILAPTIRPGIAQVYARHLAEGGVPNDERWNHIKSLCEEYSKMAGFVRATKNHQFNESAQQLVNEGVGHYVHLRETLGKLRGHRGYTTYFESWTPTLMEDESDDNTLNELFVQETMDPRIESVLPILSKLRKSVVEMKEVDELAEWADSLTEAPGDETLAHNEKTEKDRLKALDLAEDDDAVKAGQTARDKIKKPAFMRKAAGEKPATLGDVERSQQHRSSQAMVGQKGQEVEESGLQAYLGNKKYGKDGMDALRKAGRDGASKEKMASIRAKYDKLDEEGMEEGWNDRLDDPDDYEGYLERLRDLADYNRKRDIEDPPQRHKAPTDDSKKQADESVDDMFSLSGKLPPTDRIDKVGGQDMSFDEKMKANTIKHLLQKNPSLSQDELKGKSAAELIRMSREGVAEDLDANQKRVGQLGPTEKVKNNNIGKLVGANESLELNEMDKSQPSSDRGGESSGNPYAKGGKATPVKAKDAEKDAEKALNKSMDKAHKKDVKEGQEDLDAILRIIRK